MIDLNSYTTQEVATLKQRTLTKRHVLAQVIAQFSQQYPNEDFIDRALMRVMLEIGSVLGAIEQAEVEVVAQTTGAGNEATVHEGVKND